MRWVARMKKQKNPCKGCIWKTQIGEQLIFCQFPVCVKRKEQNKTDGRKRKESADR